MREGAIAPRGALLRARTLAFVESVPAWAWLTILVGVSTGVRLALALPNAGPSIFQDEIVYWELGSSLGSTGAFSIQGIPGTGGFGVVYPALISPAVALFESPTDAYVAAKGINALLMSLTAVPVYFLARRLVGPALSLLAAVLSVAIPGMVYTSAIMTENAFYPLIACFVLALVLALEKPTAPRQLALFAVIALAFFTRVQAATLVLVVLTAIAIVALMEASTQRFRPRAVLRALAVYNVTWLVLVGAAIAVISLQAVRGTPPRDLLGAYDGVTNFDFSPGPIARWFLYHLADLDLSVGLLPFGAFIMVVLIAFRSSRESRAMLVFAAGSLSLVFWFTLTVSAFAADPAGQRIEERNLFHVMPVFFVALVAWMSRGLPRPLWAAGPAIAAMSALPAAIPYDLFLNGTTAHSTFSLVPLWSFRDRFSLAPGDISIAVLLGGIAAGVLLALLPRRFMLIVPAVVLVYFALTHSPIEGVTTQVSRHYLDVGIGVKANGPSGDIDRRWVDRQVGAGSEVAWIWSSDFPWAVWETEFFNKSIGRVYNLEGINEVLPAEALAVDDRGFLRDSQERALVSPYVLAPGSISVDGTVVSADEVIGTRLYRVAGPVKLVDEARGLYLDRWSGSQVEYTNYSCSGGILDVRLGSYAPLHPAPQTVVASVGGREVARTTIPVGAIDEPFQVPVSAVGGRCDVAFSVDSTAVPAGVLPSTDTRELGVQFLSFELEPEGA